MFSVIKYTKDCHVLDSRQTEIQQVIFKMQQLQQCKNE